MIESLSIIPFKMGYSGTAIPCSNRGLGYYTHIVATLNPWTTKYRKLPNLYYLK